MRTKKELRELAKSLKSSGVFINNRADTKDIDVDTYFIEILNDHPSFSRFIGKKNDILFRFLKPVLSGELFFDDTHLEILYYLLLIHEKFFSIMDKAQKDKKMLHNIIDDLELSIECNGVFKEQYVIQKAKEIRKERIFFGVLRNSILLLAQYSNQRMNYSDKVKEMMKYQAIQISQIKSNSKEESYIFSPTVALVENSAVPSILNDWNTEDFSILIKMVVNLFYFPLSNSAKDTILKDPYLLRRFDLPLEWNFDEELLEEFIIDRESDEDTKLELIDFFEACEVIKPYYCRQGKKLNKEINDLK